MKKKQKKTHKEYVTISNKSVLVHTPIDQIESNEVDELMDSKKIFYWTESY